MAKLKILRDTVLDNRMVKKDEIITSDNTYLVRTGKAVVVEAEAEEVEAEEVPKNERKAKAK